ncbi:MAG: 2-oxo-4-hydroxy-4-carboxy-5-ureidoimidazoline decarboxylase [Geminicoccaceae bacterium]|nr:MAG: 2-oxo-4-hydroxy-4-carboxy-5-ureidoimidazoline decarboxylase [Geminicoccaceae bacterium]
MATIRLVDLNTMDRAAFVAALGHVVEHSPWVAEAAFAARPFANREALHQGFCDALRTADAGLQRDVLNAHPDLAGKAAMDGAIGELSAAEQHGVGLDRLSEGEYAMFHELNDAYRAKFAFPFIFAVKGASKAMILQAFEDRLPNDAEHEFQKALAEVELIARFRLDDLVSE